MITTRKGSGRRVLSGTFPPGPYESATIFAKYVLECGHTIERRVFVLGSWGAPAPSRLLYCEVCRREAARARKETR